MYQPLGSAVGNALELEEALDCLRGGGPADFRQHCLSVAGQMVILAGLADDEREASEILGPLLEGGQALAKFREWIAAQGGDVEVVDQPSRLAKAKLIEELPSPRSGYVASLDAGEVGLTSMLLGGGRAKKTDKIDHSVGIKLYAKIGDFVTEGEPLLSIHADAGARLSGARQRLLAAYGWSDDPVSPGPLIRHLVS
jgi:thymidine phosphorylase